MNLFVIFMSCENQEGRVQTARPYDLTKPEVSRVSFTSLWRALNNSHVLWRLVCSDNSSSPEYRKWVSSHYCTRARNADGTRGTVPVYPLTSYAARTVDELLRIMAESKVADDHWVCLTEDDQVYAGDAFYLVREFVGLYSGDYFVVPYVQPYRIWPTLAEHQAGPQVIRPRLLTMAEAARIERPRLVLRTPLCTWMQVFWSNGSLMCRAGLLRECFRQYPEGMTHHATAELFERIPAFAPIPPISSHFQEGCESPGFNQRVIREWVEDMKGQTP